MILKTAPHVHGQHLTSLIGSPKDYTKNRGKGSFPKSNDLEIPEGVNPESEVSENDIVCALDDMAISNSVEEKKERYGVDSEQYLPIKKLNQFSTDWVIKA